MEKAEKMAWRGGEDGWGIEVENAERVPGEAEAEEGGDGREEELVVGEEEGIAGGDGGVGGVEANAFEEKGELVDGVVGEEAADYEAEVVGGNGGVEGDLGEEGAEGNGGVGGDVVGERDGEGAGGVEVFGEGKPGVG